MKKRLYGEGTVDQLPSGRWRARMRVEGRLVPVRPGVTYDTAKLANAALAATLTDRSRGDWIDPSKGQITLKDYAEQLLDERVELSKATVAQYRSLLKVHVYPRLGHVLVADLHPPTVRQWYAALAKAMPDSSIPAKAYKTLRAVCSIAVADEVMLRNPCAIRGAGKERAAERPTVDPEQLDGIVAAVPERFQAAVEVAALTGLRYGELFGLRRMDIDLMHCQLHVRGVLEEVGGKVSWRDHAKTDAGTGRVIHFDPALGAVLAAHMETYTVAHPEALVFMGERRGWMLRSSWGRIWRKARAEVGLPSLHLHDLRHTAATWMAEEGATDAELLAFLGHRDREMLLRYTHAREGRKAKLAEQVAAKRRDRGTNVRRIKGS